MFASPVTSSSSTPFSVKDILSLEQQQQQQPSGGLASLELPALGPPPSCMLAAFKQELPYPPAPQPPKGPAAFCAKSYAGVDPAKEPSKGDRKGTRPGEGGGGGGDGLEGAPGARGGRQAGTGAPLWFRGTSRPPRRQGLGGRPPPRTPRVARKGLCSPLPAPFSPVSGSPRAPPPHPTLHW